MLSLLSLATLLLVKVPADVDTEPQPLVRATTNRLRLRQNVPTDLTQQNVCRLVTSGETWIVRGRQSGVTEQPNVQKDWLFVENTVTRETGWIASWWGIVYEPSTERPTITVGHFVSHRLLQKLQPYLERLPQGHLLLTIASESANILSLLVTIANFLMLPPVRDWLASRASAGRLLAVAPAGPMSPITPAPSPRPSRPGYYKGKVW